MLGTDECYKSLDEKPYESFFVYVEARIERPLKQVWPHALDIGGWMSAHRLETVCGQPGQVGHFERVYPHGLDDKVALPHYHLYGVTEIVPFKMIVLEVFPEKGGSYGRSRQKMSFDSIVLTEVGSDTVVGFHMVDVHMGIVTNEYREQRKKELVGVRRMLEEYFENLRRLVIDSENRDRLGE